jgi:hypothetical protein
LIDSQVTERYMIWVTLPPIVEISEQ